MNEFSSVEQHGFSTHIAACLDFVLLQCFKPVPLNANHWAAHCCADITHGLIDTIGSVPDANLCSFSYEISSDHALGRRRRHCFSAYWCSNACRVDLWN